MMSSGPRSGRRLGAGFLFAALLLGTGFVIAAILPAGAGSTDRAAPDPAGSARVRTIVIDPGHGGLDVGAKGRFGSLEKDITLALSLKLKALIERSMSYRVVLTRDKDLGVSHENRATAANNNDALLFISIHVNGAVRNRAHGAETFFLSLNASDEEARKLAYLENSSGELEKSIADDAKDDVKMILWDMAQSAYLKQSQRLAEIIQEELNQALGIENRGVKQAHFKILRGVACPAVLVEVAFISNPDEEQKLVDEAFQAQVAESLHRGLIRYLKLYPPS